MISLFVSINSTVYSTCPLIYVLFAEHDDRGDDFSPKGRDNKLKGRRVSFKPTRGGGAAGRGRFTEMAIRSHLDNDEDMDGELPVLAGKVIILQMYM